jgi:hypothetical protein
MASDKLQMDIRRAVPEPDLALNSDPALNRETGALLFQLFSDLIKQCIDTGMAMAKWLLTVLVAVNGGAAVAVGGIAMSSGFKVAAVGLFLVGILSALSASVAVLITLPSALKPVGAALGYWMTVKIDGERIPDDFGEQQKEMEDAISKAAAWPWALGIVSISLFVIGIVVSAAGLLSA